MSNRINRRSKKRRNHVHLKSRAGLVGVLTALVLIGVGTVAAPWGHHVTTRTVPSFLNPLLPISPPNQPSKEYIYAGGKLIATEEPAITLFAPNSLSALTISNEIVPRVSINWSSVTGATHYEVERRSDVNASYSPVASNVSGTTFNDTNVNALTAYLYRVRAVDAQGNVSSYSNVDLATAIVFTDDSLVSQSTLVKAAHITELRQAVDAIRTMAHLPATNWGGSITQFQTQIEAAHVQDLRVSLSEGLSALSLPPCSYTDNSLTELRASLIKKEHIEQLRQCVR
jgi:hypothetical protein